MKLKKVLVVYYVHNYKTLERVEKILTSNGIKYRCVRRVYLKRRMLNGTDLVITVGGDGTFLRTTHIIEKTPVLNVTSDVEVNEAFYARATRDDFDNKIKRLQNGKYKITKLPRLEAKLNGIILPMLAVNEVFVGSKHPYHTARYILNVKGKNETQKSSGIIMATNTGSSGWAKSAAKQKLVIPIKGFGYVVREPYFGRLAKPKMLVGYLKENEKVSLKSQNHQGIIAIDSALRTFNFIDGDILEVKVSKKPLNYIEF